MLKVYAKTSKVLLNFAFSPKSSSEGIDCFLTDRRKKFHQNLKNFPFKVRKKLGFKVPIDTLSSSEKSCGHMKCSFENHAKAFCQTPGNLSDQTQKPKITIFLEINYVFKNSFGGINYIFIGGLLKMIARNPK